MMMIKKKSAKPKLDSESEGEEQDVDLGASPTSSPVHMEDIALKQEDNPTLIPDNTRSRKVSRQSPTKSPKQAAIVPKQEQNSTVQDSENSDIKEEIVINVNEINPVEISVQPDIEPILVQPSISKVVQPQANVTQHKSSTTPQQSFTCKICFKSFTQNHKLKRHELTHSDIRPYKCTDCGKGFIEKYKLKRHQVGMGHTGEEIDQAQLEQMNSSMEAKSQSGVLQNFGSNENDDQRKDEDMDDLSVTELLGKYQDIVKREIKQEARHVGKDPLKSHKF